MLKTAAELLEEFDGKLPPMPQVNFCYKCNACLDDYKKDLGCRKTQKGLMCDDCYYAMMSDYIDEHPITSPPDIE